MTSNPNTMDFKQTWSNAYQITHYKATAFKAIADESIKEKVHVGQQYHRTNTGDFVAQNTGGDGGYNTQAIADVDETLTVNFDKNVSFYVKRLDELQAHLPVRMKYARKAMQRLFLQIDGDVFNVAYQGAGSVVDDGSIGGTAGNGIAPSVSNIQAVFGASETALRLANVIYDPAAKFTGDYKLDRQSVMPVAVISAQLYNILLLYLGGKTSMLGDKVSLNGFVGMFFNFNLFVSNNLAWSGSLVLSTNPIDGDSFTFLNGVSNKIQGVTTNQALVYRFKTTPVAAGDIVIASTAAKTVINLVNALTNPYTTIANATDTGYVSWTQTSLTITQQLLLGNITASQNIATTGTTLNAIIAGLGNVPVSQSQTAAANIWTLAKQVQHNIFGANNSISVVIQKTPELLIQQPNPASNSGNSGRIGHDFITWTAYGIKVFGDQSPMLVDVQIRTDGFTTAPVSTFS